MVERLRYWWTCGVIVPFLVVAPTRDATARDLTLGVPVASVQERLGSAAIDGESSTSLADLRPVTSQRLRGGTDAADWLMYGGDYRNWRYSPLTDIHQGNVADLQVAWIFQTGIPSQLQAAPIVADGVLYLSTAYNHLHALDATSGEPLWRYDHPLPDDLRLCCGPGNRGVAIAESLVLMATLDARLVALDRATGSVAWNVRIGAYTDGYSATAAPLVVKDKVVVGIAGGEYGIRGYVDAYNLKTGRREWRRYTIPSAGDEGVESWAGDSWKNGGGPTWVTGAYDPELDVVYWATGNPAPDWNGDVREGDNLYTNSVLALDPQTGKIRWHFQFTPHDVWDYDGNTGLLLVDVFRNGERLQAITQPNRNGYLYALSRRDGRYLHATQYVDTLNWSKGLDEHGRPRVDPAFVPALGGSKAYICPGSAGGQNGSFSAAYSPQTRLLYVPVIESCFRMQKSAAIFIQGVPFWGGGPGVSQGDDQTSYGHLSAIDASTGAVRWRYTDEYPLVGGTLATGGGLVFTGTQAGHALAFDDTTGAVLWKFQTGSVVRGQPITYKIDGRQYVAVPSGGGGLVVTFVGEPPLVSKGSALVVFALPVPPG